MKLILKYFKPFLLWAILSIVLLFTMNMLDLQLPKFMGDMVDTGIMRGGIEEPVPRALSGEARAFLLDYATEGVRQEFVGAYALATGDVLTDEILKDFPNISDSDFVLMETDAETLELLGKWYNAAAVEISARYGVTEASDPANISKLGTSKGDDVSLFYTSAMDGEMSVNIDDVPATQQLETGATLTRFFYRELGASDVAIQQKTIMRLGGIMLAIALGSVLITALNGLISSKVSSGIGRNLRHDLFAKVQTYSPAEFDHFSTATLITRCQGDIQRVQMVSMMALRMMLSAPIMAISGLVRALQTSLDLSWIIAVTILALIAMQLFIFSRVIPRFRIMQKLTDKLNLVTRESLTGMLVIRAFGNEAREAERFDEANRDISNAHRFIQRTMTLLQPLMGLINGLTTLAIMLIGAHLVDRGSLEVGKMMAFSQYVMMIVMAFMFIGMMFIMIPQALVSAQRISEVLEKDTDIIDKPANELKTLGGRARGEIVFDNVSFRYPNAEVSVLSNLSFTARPGEMTAFIGSTGSGKSTLINLLPRFYDVSEGTITIDGIDIRDLAVKELRENIGYVPQKGLLFSGDVASNLSYGKSDGTDEEFREALRVAQAESFVFADKEGLATEIAQGGDNVSGGQRQRLSIARALVKNPPVYIFDDSFSALDYKTDVALRRDLRQYTTDATTLIVAQRISTIMFAHQIIVLDAGKIVGKGTHAELLESCEAYREIAESQLSKEELA